MQIAVTSQNRKTITEHAGKCRKFWIYEVEKGVLTGKRLVEIGIEQSLHASAAQLAEPLAGTNTLITRGMGPGLYERLMQSGILPVVTIEEDPDAAVSAMLSNTLSRLPVARRIDLACHEHGHFSHIARQSP
ncbi:NifB/NifX family molybdenum-iron cluster-binding protein [Candidatus Accumulibacter sp. ACC012]|uniref:NifB/NifX family molybdenum-iron cluster-binding protein n=1 Tax=Candidatus Accumulibacter sp. ACC012 TaxID=2823332 RepID=UPI0025C460FD|nr:NifB/NifX family molybdenum-iron cluster-binding protein [Candidatus Accumulibacter sp. ACC012]